MLDLQLFPEAWELGGGERIPNQHIRFRAGFWVKNVIYQVFLWQWLWLHHLQQPGSKQTPNDCKVAQNKWDLNLNRSKTGLKKGMISYFYGEDIAVT